LLGRLLAEHLPGVTWRPPEGTYLAWLDCRGLDLPGAEQLPSAPGDEPGVTSRLAGPAGWFLDQASVAVTAGHLFGPGGEGRVRLNFATSCDVLTRAVAQMGAAASRLRSGGDLE
jgi:cystathionine beta-lyase